MIPEHLDSGCPVPCSGNCPKAIKRSLTGWFITMGHPGFNSPANNAGGYATERTVLRALNRYSRGGN